MERGGEIVIPNRVRYDSSICMNTDSLNRIEMVVCQEYSVW